jgi:transposase
MLYDLTNTYVEGDAWANPMMRRGYSRDHRPNCLQLVLALIGNAKGIPCRCEVFNGNRADVTTMEVISAHGGAKVRQGAEDLGYGPRHGD